MSDRTSAYRIHTYTAAEAGLFVNSYLIETAEGVVLVDANLLLSDIRALAARIAALRKPLLGVFVTHAHPDHFNGLPMLAGDEVPVYAAAGVAATIARIADAKRAQWKPVYGDEWPDHHRVPDRRLSTGDAVELGTLRFTMHSVGAAESHADSYLTLDDQAFIGDLAFNGTHPYTADGHGESWARGTGHPRRSARGGHAVSGTRSAGRRRHAGRPAAIPDDVPGDGGPPRRRSASSDRSATRRVDRGHEPIPARRAADLDDRPRR
jgi:glyoxylase-like metal-dependent hydrolase (beta-lactamase superfamily II)